MATTTTILPKKQEPTNQERLLFILDNIAEPFPFEAKSHSCACGAGPESASGPSVEKEESSASPLQQNSVATSKESKSQKRVRKCKCDLVEEAILESLTGANKMSATSPKTLKEYLGSASDVEVGKLITTFNIPLVDQQLYDLAIFQTDATKTFSDLLKWDKERVATLEL